MKKNQGITLVALIVTMIVLVILTTVSINAVFSEGGIIQKAQTEKKLHENDIKTDEGSMNALLKEYNDKMAEQQYISFTVNGIGTTYKVLAGSTWYDVIHSPINNEMAQLSGLIDEAVLLSYEYGYMLFWGDHGEPVYCPPAGAPEFMQYENGTTIMVDDKIIDGYTY